MFQMKVQDKTPEEELREVEIGNLPKKEFRVMIVKMIKELRRRMDAQSKKLLFNRGRKYKERGELQDGGGVRHGDHLPPHRYIRNTSTCGTTPTEHLLNAGRRPQTSHKARNSPRTWVGQKKKKKQR